MGLLDTTSPAIVTPERRALRHAYMKAYLNQHGPRRWLRMPWHGSARLLRVRGICITL